MKRKRFSLNKLITFLVLAALLFGCATQNTQNVVEPVEDEPTTEIDTSIESQESTTDLSDGYYHLITRF